jgi:hypothetical protein
MTGGRVSTSIENVMVPAVGYGVSVYQLGVAAWGGTSRPKTLHYPVHHAAYRCQRVATALGLEFNFLGFDCVIVLYCTWILVKQSKYLYYVNNIQYDALLIFSLLSYLTAACFGRVSSQSSGGRMYICGKLYLLYFKVDCQRGWPADSQIRNIKSTICHIYTFYLLMMGC